MTVTSLLTHRAQPDDLGETQKPGSMAVDLGSVLSAPEGIRTPNLLIRSQMLYPLSYGRVARRERASDTLACGPAGHEIG